MPPSMASNTAWSCCGVSVHPEVGTWQLALIPFNEAERIHRNPTSTTASRDFMRRIYARLGSSSRDFVYGTPSHCL